MKTKRVLVLGGTRFVGRHIVEAVVEAGHPVTLFNRGQTDPAIFTELEFIKGDRDGGLAGLAGGSWDVVIDVNGYLPGIVRQSTDLLKHAVEQYIFISTLSVYRPPYPTGGDESAALEKVQDETSEDIQTYYGALKALCEKAVRDDLPDQHLILRLGLMAGPYDPTDRATYWIWRANQPGRIALPAGPSTTYQFLDARDLAQFVLLTIEKRVTGIYNTAGETGRWSDLLEAARSVTDIENTAVWIEDETFLAKYEPAEPRPSGFFPMRLPPDAGNYWSISSHKARSIGLETRPLRETVESLYSWMLAREPEYKWQAGLTEKQEAELISAWEEMNVED